MTDGKECRQDDLLIRLGQVSRGRGAPLATPPAGL
jgi:hypothetical protein